MEVCLCAAFCVQSRIWRKNKVLLVTWQVAQFQEDALVHFLCDPSHFGAHVTYEEEANGAGAHYDLGYPESHVPAVLFGDGAEGETCHKSPNCNKNNCFLVMWKSQHWNSTVSHTCFGWSCLSAVYHSPSVPQQRETFHRNLKEHSHWLSPQTRQLVHKRKTQRRHRGGGSRSEQDEMKMQNSVLESFLHFRHIKFLCPETSEFTSFSDTPIRTEMGWRSWTQRGASWVKTGSSFECFKLLTTHDCEAAMAGIKNYLWDFRCDGDSEEVHRHVHSGHHENK